MVDRHDHPYFELRVNGKVMQRTTKHKQLQETAFCESHSMFHNDKVEIVNTETGEITYY